MAGVATQIITLTVTGLGDTTIKTVTQALTVPIEKQEGYTIVAAATTTAIQLFDMVDHIALDKIYALWIKAEVGTIYINVDTTGTATFAAGAADLVLNAGEAAYLPINPAGNLGVTIDASSITDAFSWQILGQA